MYYENIKRELCIKMKGKKIFKRSGIFLFSAALACAVNYPGNMSVYAETQNTDLGTKDRICGSSRYETAVQVSEYGWNTSDYVVLANGESFADALCASPLAKKYNSPILLTKKDNIDESTLNEIKKLKASHVFIIGEYGAVSKECEDKITALGIEVTRLGGNSRYETSAEVAKALGNVDKIAIASGEGYADALSAAPAAAAQTDKESSMAILLTEKDNMPDAVQKYISDNRQNIKQTFIIGGTGVISSQASKKAPDNFIRLWGKDRYETNVKIMLYFSKELKFDRLYVAEGNGPRGNEFADALSGTALAALTDSPVVLTCNTLPKVTSDFIKSMSLNIVKIQAVGGTGAVSDEIIASIKKIASQSTQSGGQTNSGTAGSQSSQSGSSTSSGSGGTQGSGSGTGNTSGSGTSSGESTMQELKDISSQLDTVYDIVKTSSEKNVVLKIKSSINRTISDSSYDPKIDAQNVKSMYNSLTSEEKSDLKDAVMSNMDVSELIKLAGAYGL